MFFTQWSSSWMIVMVVFEVRCWIKSFSRDILDYTGIKTVWTKEGTSLLLTFQLKEVHIFLFKLTGKGDVFSLAGVKAISQHIQIWSKILCASLFAKVTKTALVTSSSTFYFIRRTGVLVQKLWNRSVEIPFILEVLLIKCINLKKLIYTAIKVFAKREDLWR